MIPFAAARAGDTADQVRKIQKQAEEQHDDENDGEDLPTRAFARRPRGSQRRHNGRGPDRRKRRWRIRWRRLTILRWHIAIHKQEITSNIPRRQAVTWPQ